MIIPSRRMANFQYAIRSFFRAAKALERAEGPVTYLNIGDPQAFGFRPPEHIVEPVWRALKDGFNGYSHSAGLQEARESVACYAMRLGVPTTADDGLLYSEEGFLVEHD